jgi:phenylacetate-CoA ligase
MSENIPYYERSLDFEALWREFPPSAEYMQKVHRMSKDELHAIRERRFLAQVERGWQIPFYQRHWAKAGLAPTDIRSLDDLQHIPPYDVHDLRESIERQPPWGDYIGIDMKAGAPMPLMLQTSGGTTGMPRPMLYSPRDREVLSILTGRRLYMAGVRPFDIIQVTLTLGLSNGGMIHRDGIWKYTGALPVMTGSGNVTPTRRQIEIMKEWGVTIVVGFPAYLRHMAYVARDEMNIDVAALNIKGVMANLGVDDRAQLEQLWGAPVFDCYATHDCGVIATDCEHRTGMHVFEDTVIVEINDAETLKPKPVGEKGNVFLTTLFKHAAPAIRYNINDISAWLPGKCACGGTHARLDRIFGRSDNMVKLRGVNLFPEAIGALVSQHQDSNGEYVCIVECVGSEQRDEMTVLVEAKSASVDAAKLAASLESRFREAFGIKLAVKAVPAGELDTHTGLSKTSKTKRLIDKRKESNTLSQ